MSFRNGIPLIKCNDHGLVPSMQTCPKCLVGFVAENKELKKHLAGAPEVIEKLVAEGNEMRKRIEELEGAALDHVDCTPKGFSAQ